MKTYGRALLFFFGVSLSWLGAFASGPTVDPVMDSKAPLKSIGYSAGSLALWLALLGGGLWAVPRDNATALLVVLLGWGFLIAPVVVVVVMRLLFPGISRRLQEQVDEIGRARRARQRAR
jgi:hypothetical protein